MGGLWDTVGSWSLFPAIVIVTFVHHTVKEEIFLRDKGPVACLLAIGASWQPKEHTGRWHGEGGS